MALSGVAAKWRDLFAAIFRLEWAHPDRFLRYNGVIVGIDASPHPDGWSNRAESFICVDRDENGTTLFHGAIDADGHCRPFSENVDGCSFSSEEERAFVARLPPDPPSEAQREQREAEMRELRTASAERVRKLFENQPRFEDVVRRGLAHIDRDIAAGRDPNGS